jgi:hypothetical protein
MVESLIISDIWVKVKGKMKPGKAFKPMDAGLPAILTTNSIAGMEQKLMEWDI